MDSALCVFSKVFNLLSCTWEEELFFSVANVHAVSVAMYHSFYVVVYAMSLLSTAQFCCAEYFSVSHGGRDSFHTQEDVMT